ncbi:sel1 repeat family protein [Xylophilus sp. GW821-FHT01B05]
MRGRRHVLAVASLLCAGLTAAQAQTTIIGIPGGSGVTAPAPSAAAADQAATGARYVEACQQSIERGISGLGCQGTLYANEINNLKEEALRTNNASLLTLLGDAYQSNRSAVSDIGQAYRWYLLGAVRGDPRAMERLTSLYKDGRGTRQDKVKALGYARLTQRLAIPGSASAQGAADAIRDLGSEMADEEVVLAERFASEFETMIRSRAGAAPAAGAAMPGTASVPGVGAAQPSAGAVPPSAPVPSVPGQERSRP